MKTQRIIMAAIGLMTLLTAHAQLLIYEGAFTNDTKKKTYREARVELTLNDTQLRLMVLPITETPLVEALVDTLWSKRSYYQEGDNESTDFFEEKNVFYLYQLEDDKYLESYVVFSQFVDKQNKEIQQIVIRKFNEKGTRVWCVNIDTDAMQANRFFRLLQNARKTLKYDKLEKVESRPDPNVQHKKEYEDYKIQEQRWTPGTNPYYTR